MNSSAIRNGYVGPVVNSELLISAVRARRPIWDKNHDQYNNLKILDEVWNEIAVLLGVTAPKARSKWKNLKDAFRREIKKVSMSEKYHCKWRYYQQLMFLYDSKFEGEEDQNISNFPVSEVDQTDQTMDQTIKFEYEYHEPDGLQQEDSVIVDSNPIQVDEQPVPSYSGNNYSVRNNLQLEDPDLCFFKSLLPHLKELGSQRRMELKIKIHELVYREIYNKGNSSNSSGNVQ